MEMAEEEKGSAGTITKEELIAGAKKECRDLLIKSFGMFIISIVLFFVLRDDARKHPKNMYTQRHWHFNQGILLLLLVNGLDGLINVILKKDMYGFCKCCGCLFRLIRRLIDWGSFIFHVIFMFLYAYRSVKILKENWWTSDDEPFRTNESALNAAACWASWSFVFLFTCLFFGLVFPIMICAMCIMVAKGQTGPIKLLFAR